MLSTIFRQRCTDSLVKYSKLAKFAMSTCDLPRVCVRKVENESEMSLSFVFSEQKWGIQERRFNFQRNQMEELCKLKARIATNIERNFGKKIKKKKEKCNAADAPTQLNDVDDKPDQDNWPPVVNLYLDGKCISDDTIGREAFIPGAVLQIGETKYRVVVNPPTVKSITLPTDIMVGFLVYPKLDVEFSLKDQSQFKWYRSINRVSHLTEKHQISEDTAASSAAELPAKKKIKTIYEIVKGWELVGEEFSYLTQEDDLGRKLKVTCVPRSEHETGETCEAESPVVVTQGPGHCPFDDRHMYTKQPAPENAFRTVTYNILANLYADSDFTRTVLHPYCPAYALSIDYRKQLILKEITGYNADLICLQEVDDDVFRHDICPSLNAIGFEGIFNLKGRNCAEGLACFYRTNKFKLVDSHSFILGEAVATNPIFGDIHSAASRNDKLQIRLTERSTALQIAILKSTECDNKIICLAHTHLYFHPDADHIRLLQAAMCVKYLEQVVASTSAKNPNAQVAAMMCGDFNSCPEFGVYRLFTTQFIPTDLADWTSNEDEAVKGLSLSHSLTLESAAGTPEFTNFTPGFTGCLDYIFIDYNNMKTIQVVPLPSEDAVRKHTGLPSIVVPSDHLAVICDIEWKTK